MTLCNSSAVFKNRLGISNWNLIFNQKFHTTPLCARVQSGRYRPVRGRNQLLTYEMSKPPHEIAHTKSWNSWNTTTVQGGRRSQLTTVEDMFIRKFMSGTWHGMILGEQVIIKRQYNIIRIAVCVRRNVALVSMYFLIGYTEEMLSIWLQCPVKLELQTISKYEGYVKVI